VFAFALSEKAEEPKYYTDSKNVLRRISIGDNVLLQTKTNELQPVAS